MALLMDFMSRRLQIEKTWTQIEILQITAKRV
jgi:hypothetical protein